MSELTRRCTKCGEDKPLGQFYPRSDRPAALRSVCRECGRASAQRSYAAHRERYLERARQAQLQRYREDPDKARAITRQKVARSAAKLRAEVFDHYGTACACCGTTERLTIDHTDGDGHEARQEIGSGTKLYRWLRPQRRPPGHQTLCLPCNASKGTGTQCRRPHPDSPRETETAA